MSNILQPLLVKVSNFQTEKHQIANLMFSCKPLMKPHQKLHFVVSLGIDSFWKLFGYFQQVTHTLEPFLEHCTDSKRNNLYSMYIMGTHVAIAPDNA